MILGATEQTQSADFTVLGLALLLPLWALTATVWPAEHRRPQAALAALYGAFGALLLGILSRAPAGPHDGFHADRSTVVIAVSASLTTALHVLARRLTASRT